MRFSVYAVNWLYLALSMLIIIWACIRILGGSLSKDRGGKTHYKRYKRRDNLLKYLWRKHYRAIIVALALLLSITIVFADNLLAIENTPAKDELSSLLLLFTGAIVFWYTRETYDLKVISQDVKKIQQQEFDFANRPYQRLQWSSNGGEVLQIVNAGKGLSRDVCYETIKLDKNILFAPLRRPVIAAGQLSTISRNELQQTADLIDMNGAGEYKTDLKAQIDQLLKNGELKEIHITYLDLRDQVYDAFFIPDERYNDRFNIKSQEKRS